MEEIEYRGEWWIPDPETDEWVPEDADDRTAGVLEFDPDNGGELDLIGTLTGIGEPPKEIDIIHGQVTNGEFVTLRDCFLSQSGTSISGTTMRNQTAHIGQVFSNGLFEGGEPEFTELKLTYPLLEMWTRADTVVQQMPPEYDHFGAQIESREPVIAKLDDAEVKLSIANKTKNHEWKGVEITQTAQLTIIPDEELTFSEYLNDYVRHIQHFLCLAVGEPVNPDTITGCNPSNDENKDKHKVDIAYQVPHLLEVPEKKHPNKVLFSLKDIEFEHALQQWFENANGAQTLHNLYFGTVYNGDMFEENRFLSLAIAIEGYQSYLFPDHRLMAKSQYDDLHDDVMDTIPDDSPVRDRIDGLLNSIGNHPSLRNQIEMVFNEYDDILPEIIDVDDIAKRTTDNRHYLAHALEDGSDSATLGSLARTLQVVIEAFLLDAIGLNSEFIIEKLQQNRKYYLNN